MSDLILSEWYGKPFLVYPPEKDGISAALLRRELDGGHELECCCSRVIRGGNTVLDIGAHIGTYTTVYSDLVGPFGRVIAFEPDPTSFMILTHNLAKRRSFNTCAFPLAVANTNRESLLYLNGGDNLGDHGLVSTNPNQKSIGVQVVSLDSFLGPDFQVDFAKIDVQGAELEVLRGMKEIIKRASRLVLLLEFYPAGLRRHSGEGSDRELESLLLDLGFSICGTFGEIPQSKSWKLVDVTGHLCELFSQSKGLDPLVNVFCIK